MIWYTKVYLFGNQVVNIFNMFMITNKLDQLTPRERAVFNHLIQGLLYKEIAVKLSIGMDTVKKHCKNIYIKLGVINRTEATMLGHEISKAFTNN
jgi:two-component system, NarL family, response regulator LiaR